MTQDELVAYALSIIFDDDLGHLKLSDVRGMVSHLQHFLTEEEEAESEEDLHRFIL